MSVFFLPAPYVFARGEQNNLIGFDQGTYAQLSESHNRSLENIFEEYESVRKATITLFKYLLKNLWTEWGIALQLLLMPPFGHWRTILLPPQRN